MVAIGGIADIVQHWQEIGERSAQSNDALFCSLELVVHRILTSLHFNFARLKETPGVLRIKLPSGETRPFRNLNKGWLLFDSG